MAHSRSREAEPILVRSSSSDAAGDDAEALERGVSNSSAADVAGSRKRTLSIEYLSPAPYSRERQSSLSGAVFNLSATILGGGILSLPFCFSLCGIVGGVLFLSFVAVASNFSIYILISCSRRVRHGASYEEVVAAAFGRSVGRGVQATLFALVYLVIVAYLILIRDLICPLLELGLGLAAEISPSGRTFVVLLVLLLILPMCMQRHLSGLKWLSMACVIPIGVLTCIVVLRGGEQEFLAYSEPDRARFQEGGGHLKLLPSSSQDALYALPILACAYMCHFNVLPLHRELIRPTRPRIKRMITAVTGICSSLYILVGVGGYAFARAKVDGNILNNFRTDDPLAVVGRASLAFTIVCGFPYCVLPARQVFGRILGIVWPSLGMEAEYNEIGGAAASTVAAGSVAPPPAVLPPSRLSRHVSSSDDSAAAAGSWPSIDGQGTIGGGADMFAHMRARIDHDPLAPEIDSESEEDDEIDDAELTAEYAAQQQQQQQRSSSDHAAARSGLGSQRATHPRSSSDGRHMPSRGGGVGNSTLLGSAALTEGSPLLGSASSSSQPAQPSQRAPLHISSLDVAPAAPFFSSGSGSGTMTPSSAALLSAAGLDGESASDLSLEREPVYSDRALSLHTMLICFSALLLSARVASVATLWNLVGSSACILLSYVLPAACYLRIRREKPLGLRMLCAWAMLVLGAAAMAVCTYESFSALLLQTAPEAAQGVVPSTVAAAAAVAVVPAAR